MGVPSGWDFHFAPFEMMTAMTSWGYLQSNMGSIQWWGPHILHIHKVLFYFVRGEGKEGTQKYAHCIWLVSSLRPSMCKASSIFPIDCQVTSNSSKALFAWLLVMYLANIDFPSLPSIW